MTLATTLPAINASLNAVSFLLAVAGWRAIRARKPRLHARLMVSAVTASALFLLTYTARIWLTGTHRYPGQDWTRTLYLGVLTTHSALAPIVLVLVVTTLGLAIRRRFGTHRRFARVTLPLWAYVSVTGVAVYFLLYHLGPARLVP